VAYALAIASAIVYGAADFLGGLAARGAATVSVVIVTQLAGLLVLGVLLPVLPDATPATADLAWGLAAAVFGSVGVALLYRALAIGTMAVVAPTTAICAVVIPVIVGVFLGERPAGHTIAGIALALVAIVLVSQQRAETATVGMRPRRQAVLPPGIGLALISGVAIGFFLLSLAQTDAAAGLWPLVVARTVSIVVFIGIVIAARIPFRMPPRIIGIAVTCGILDMLANAFYLVAVRQGPLTAVVTLSSLYPASTVVLARVVLGERLNALQTIGVVAALVAVALIVS
jgi:drug/metabolite transporter (DMT)-like permease